MKKDKDYPLIRKMKLRMSLYDIHSMILTFLNIDNNKNKHPENYILSQLCTETPVPAVISH